MKQYVSILLITTVCSILHAQKYDYHWALTGNRDLITFEKSGVDLVFKDGEPAKIVQKPRTFNIDNFITSVSDTKGKLLFYFNQCSLYSGDDQLVENGDAINPHPAKDIFCTSGLFQAYRGFQLAFFLPHPLNSDEYFLIHMTTDSLGQSGKGTAILQTLLDAQKTKIIFQDKLLVEADLTFGMLTAVRHGDGRSWWILIPEHNTNSYFSLLLDENGNFHGPFRQSIGSYNKPRVWTGSATFSPDGSWYARFDEANGLQIMRFDRCTGLFNGYQTLEYDWQHSGGTGLAFSDNNYYLYCSLPYNIFQINLQSDQLSEQDILKIADLDRHPDNPALPTGFSKMQLGPDGKIYISNWGANYLHVIHEPDKAGVACNLEQHAIKLPTLIYSSMPYMPNYRLGPISCEDACCGDPDAQQSPYTLSPNPGKGLYRIRATDAHMNRFRLFDVSGKLLMDNRFVPCLESEIDIRHLPPGLYPLHIHGPDTFHTFKLLKI